MMVLMERNVSRYLQQWQKSKNRKPLVLRGSRQVGKSWLAKKLGEDFEVFVEINFDKSPEIASFFEGNLDIPAIIGALAGYLAKEIIPGKTLLFFDEIQNCPRAITALRYFYEDFPELHVLAAGSLLDFELEKISVPVGRVEFLHIYPMTFGEFLTAIGKNQLRELLLGPFLARIPEPIHKELLKEIRNFFLLGGMPEVVKTYIESRDFQTIFRIQTALLSTYRDDFKKYAKKHEIKYLELLFDTLPMQIGRKFKYVNISQDIKSRDLKNSLELLAMAGLVYKVYHSSGNGIPLAGEKNLRKFKALFFDIGLTQRILKLDTRQLLLDPNLFQINNGVLAELFVGLELLHYQEPFDRANIFYWHREAKSSNSEVDYLFERSQQIIPIEVKSGSTGQLKSLQYFLTSKQQAIGIKIANSPFQQDGSIYSLPFYGIEAFCQKGLELFHSP